MREYAMKRLTRTEWIAEIILCHLLVIFAGLFSIYFLACRTHSPSRSLAETAAKEISETGSVLHSEKYLTYSIFFLPEPEEGWTENSREGSTGLFFNMAGSPRSRNDAEEISAPALHSRTLPEEAPPKDAGGIQALRQYYGQQDLQIDPFIKEIASFCKKRTPFYTLQGSLFPLRFTIMAGHPAAGGYVIAARELEHAPAFCISYMLFSSILYYAVVFSIISQRRSRDRVEQIYHQYISNISHELKSPIASIQAITEILNEGNIRDEAALSRYYGIITREARLLEHSVLQIIELSKLQDKRQKFEKKQISAHGLLDPVCERFAARCEEADIHFHVDDSVWLLPDLYTDAARLRELIDILLDNAFKFVPEEGNIFIDATSKHGQATLRVNDDGRGISPADFPHIFERFYKTGIDNPTGTGLGLAIAREIANGLHEEIWAQSTEGLGTIFFVTVVTRK